MLTKSIFSIISFICGINALSTFIDKGVRPELFELTDNEVATLRITIPPEEVDIMKESLNRGSIPTSRISMKESLQQAQFIIPAQIDALLRMNYTLLSSEYPLKDMFPQLKIGDDGMSQLNREELLKGYHFEPEYYVKVKSRNNIIYDIVQSNPDFDAITLIMTFMGLNLVESPYMDPAIVQLVKELTLTGDVPDYKTKNSTLVFEVKDVKKTFNKVTFSVGGITSLFTNKPGYNIKIRGKDDLFGRIHIKLRPDATEPTYLRNKLSTDIHNAVGLKSISTNYVTLYINDEYFGLFIMSDKYKTTWIEKEYGEKDTKSLYKCVTNLESTDLYNNIENENEDITDITEVRELLVKFDKAQSAADIEDIFEVDQFLKEVAIEYLTGSWDNLNNGNNIYLYKQPNGKWIYLTYDYDNSFGVNMDSFFCGFIFTDFPERMNQFNTDYPNYSITEYFKPVYRENVHHMIDILILKDPSRFEKILSDIVEKVFNPATLYPHIDQLKELIKPYVEKEKIRNENGIYPGGYNIKSEFVYSLEEWDANSEFTTVDSLWGYNAYGIKYWILAKYRNVCKTYSLKCDPIYMDENYKYSVDKEVEFKGYGISETPLISGTNTSVPTTTEIETPTTTEIEIPTPTDIETPTTTEIESPTNEPSSEIHCWSELLGYPCCPSSITTVYAHDEYGDWSYNFGKKEWCGLTPITESDPSDECWSEIYGYPCCKGCKVYETDEDGSWGYESNHWCGIPSTCQL